MGDKLSSLMEDLQARIEELRPRNINEAQTKEWLIRPFFEGLGWDFTDFNQVIPELSDQAGKRPDYSFQINGETLFLLEAKALSDPLTDQKMIIEKLDYCSNLNVPLLLITNGDLYRIYYSQLRGIGEEKLLAEFMISGDWDEILVAKLRRTAFAENELVNYARDLFILANIKDAVETLFANPSRRFINDVNEAVKNKLGHKFGADEVKKALACFSIELNQEQLEQENDAQAIEPEADDQFQRVVLPESKELYDRLLEKLRAKGLEFIEKPTKVYIGLWNSKRSFCQIRGQKRGLKVWINLDMKDLPEQDTLFVRDVSKIGHLGLGDIEANVTCKSDLDRIANIIKKAYEKAG